MGDDATDSTPAVPDATNPDTTPPSDPVAAATTANPETVNEVKADDAKSHVSSPKSQHSPTPSLSSLSNYDGPDLGELNNLVGSMKQTLSTLAETFGSFGAQTAQVASLKPDIDTAHQIKHIRLKLKKQEQKQSDDIVHLRSELETVLAEKIHESLRDELGRMISREVEDKVRDEVTRQMAVHIPVLMERQNKEHRRQIAEIRKNLHNSEARRANSLLKSNNLFDPLHPLLRPNGERSSIFPKSLAATFALGTEVSQLLCREYNLPETESKEANLNRFLHHIGVGFQMVATPMTMMAESPIIAATD